MRWRYARRDALQWPIAALSVAPYLVSIIHFSVI